MGSILMIVCVMVAMAGLASRVQANYHVSDIVRYSKQERFVACPSNYYKCDCFQYGKRIGTIAQGPPSLTNFFTITNFCGYQQLNHYHNGDGTYSVLVAGGNGKVVATCYGANKGRITIDCLIDHIFVHDYLICYGQPCQPDR